MRLHAVQIWRQGHVACAMLSAQVLTIALCLTCDRCLQPAGRLGIVSIALWTCPLLTISEPHSSGSSSAVRMSATVLISRGRAQATGVRRQWSD